AAPAGVLQPGPSAAPPSPAQKARAAPRPIPRPAPTAPTPTIGWAAALPDTRAAEGTSKRPTGLQSAQLIPLRSGPTKPRLGRQKPAAPRPGTNRSRSRRRTRGDCADRVSVGPTTRSTVTPPANGPRALRATRTVPARAPDARRPARVQVPARPGRPR